ncbi:sugar ABC transporter permease [Globicatella sp. PHS-GS-PNBC-21-1553]|uniref:carbohydrate ABC transporter permease n=1 Tax=Globicatella sp. PHS-GS-PNBC-21-1553 TaxID=2885764 RepID=UPI00298F3516|nr:sugar ABC transporter permease [Globicatella sp. PHS-GS-PNBC-21-1553]WPC09620.1 sugar ABC transporter permease [Globicatella sp. PHS-GS-PNBC-21-1553]
MEKTTNIPSTYNKAKKKKIVINATPYLLLLPSFIMIVAFLFYPMGTVFYYSFQHYDISAPFYDGFAGLDNYIKIFTKDKLFYSSLINSVKWVVSEVGLQLVFGLIFALLLNEKFKFRGFARTVTFLPWAISGVLTSVMWMLMYNEHIGVFNDILRKLGLINKNISFLSSTNSAFISVVIAELWRGIPFFAVTLLAGLQNIPDELYEAAKVDGATWIDELKNITLPQLKNTIVLTTLLRIVWEFNNVDLLYNLTGGGPANSTMTYAMYIANTAVKGSNFGYGSALTVIGFSILTIVALIYLKLSNYNEKE